MPITDALAMFAVMVALATMPSTSVALVLARSAASGFRYGAAVALGIVLGDLVFVCLALTGMSTLADTFGGAFHWVRLACGGYLLILGVQCWRARPTSARETPSAPIGGGLGCVLAGFFITLADIKAIVFYASLLPAFMDLSQLASQDVALVAAITIVAVGGTKLVYAYGANRVANTLWLTRIGGSARRVGGALLCVVGVYLVFCALEGLLVIKA